MSTPTTPGPGYRFIDPRTDTKRETDEFWSEGLERWKCVYEPESLFLEGFVNGITYRRKCWTSEPIPDDWPDDTPLWIWAIDNDTGERRLSTMHRASSWRRYHDYATLPVQPIAWMLRDESETEPPDPYEPEMSEHKNLRICTNESDEKWIKDHLQDIDHLVGLVEESFETNTSCLLSPVLRRLILDHAKKVKSQRRQLAGRTLHFDNCGEPLK